MFWLVSSSLSNLVINYKQKKLLANPKIIFNHAKHFYKDKRNKYILILYHISSFEWLENLGLKTDKLVLSLKLFSDSLNYLVN